MRLNSCRRYASKTIGFASKPNCSNLLCSPDHGAFIFQQPAANGAADGRLEGVAYLSSGASEAETTCGGADGVISCPPLLPHTFEQDSNKLITRVIINRSRPFDRLLGARSFLPLFCYCATWLFCGFAAGQCGRAVPFRGCF